jgi:plasmid segregation protein ParM
MNVNKNQSETPIVIGIDHGYGNIKTASSCFRTSVKAYDTEPTFTSNMLIYKGRYYIIGEGHKEFIPEKQNDDDYYILTLAAVARELYARNLESASVYLAAGLPLTWVGEQKDEFKAYLLREPHVDFVFKKRTFHVDFVGADILPQGFAAVANQMSEFRGVNMICDIGNGTMNVMYINDHRPIAEKMFTEKYGTHQCVLNIREQLMRRFGSVPDDTIIEGVLRFGTLDIAEKYLMVIRSVAIEYVEGIFRKLREHEYNPDLMKLYVVGGGGCLIKNFGQYDPSRVVIKDDICATAK